MPQQGDTAIICIPATYNAELGVWVIYDHAMDRPTLTMSAMQIQDWRGYVEDSETSQS